MSDTTDSDGGRAYADYGHVFIPVTPTAYIRPYTSLFTAPKVPVQLGETAHSETFSCIKGTTTIKESHTPLVFITCIKYQHADLNINIPT